MLFADVISLYAGGATYSQFSTDIFLNMKLSITQHLAVFLRTFGNGNIAVPLM